MKAVIKDTKTHLLRFDKGEEVIAGLCAYMKENSIPACFFSGIGSADEIELGFYNHFLKEYRHKPYAESLEIIGLSGNGCWQDDQAVVHMHGVFGKTDFSVLGGHVFKIKVLATAEIYVNIFESKATRTKNEEFNLNLLN